MNDNRKKKDRKKGEDPSIDRPRLTPQGRASGDRTGEDATDPSGAGAKSGQKDEPEG